MREVMSISDVIEGFTKSLGVLQSHATQRNGVYIIQLSKEAEINAIRHSSLFEGFTKRLS
jgi:hypothetical protein